MPEEKLFPLRTRTGMVFQEGALFDSLSVRDNVAYQLIQEQRPRRRNRRPCPRGTHALSGSKRPLPCFPQASPAA